MEMVKDIQVIEQMNDTNKVLRTARKVAVRFVLKTTKVSVEQL